jgi:hypothetical protein
MLIKVASSLVSTFYSKTHGHQRAKNGVRPRYSLAKLHGLQVSMFQCNQSVSHPCGSSVLQNGTILMRLVRLGIIVSKECCTLIGTVPSYFA